MKPIKTPMSIEDREKFDRWVMAWLVVLTIFSSLLYAINK